MNRIARTFKALSDETRLRILLLLIESEEMCVCDMETVLTCPQARISRHLGILKNAGLVEDRREGLWILYSIAEPLHPAQRAAIGAVKDLVSSAPEFAPDRRSLRRAVAEGRCRTFSTIKPGSLPNFMIK